MAVIAVLATLAAAGAAWAAVPRFLQLIEGAGFVRPNYEGRPVPCAAGTVLALVYGAVLLLMMTAHVARGVMLEAAVPLPAPVEPLWAAVCLVTFSLGLVGLADDVFGDRRATGLAGHLAQLRAGVLTSGAVKAIVGGVVGVAAAVLVSEGPRDWVVNALLIALCTNALNLLDLRPGRAVKGFGVFIALVWLAAPGSAVWPYVAPLVAVAAVYLPWDLRARAMLGDAGANLLGGVAGVAAAAALSPLARLALVSLLLAVHLYAERASLSELIERVAPLRWLDQWGRG
ncbi:MAG TPA: hypothetical protein VIK93_03040 [Limnochordales bacterium]